MDILQFTISISVNNAMYLIEWEEGGKVTGEVVCGKCMHYWILFDVKVGNILGSHQRNNVHLM